MPTASVLGLKTEYTWDSEGRMTQMKCPTTGTPNGKGGYTDVSGSVLTYTYSTTANDRRVQRLDRTGLRAESVECQYI